MKSSKLTVIFWNVWLEVQTGKRDDGSRLVKRLDELIALYNPDVFGLNEVVKHARADISPVMDYLKQRGYHVYFARFSPLSDDWVIGSVLATKQKPLKLRAHKLGKDYQAERLRGYRGHHVKLIEADMKVGGRDVTILVNYLQALLPRDWGAHIQHRRKYEAVLATVKNRNVIVGGDFNETKYMLPWLRLPEGLKRKTGRFHQPTWRPLGKRRLLAFANYDHLLYSHQGDLDLEHFKVLKRWPSDHAPLLAKFTVRS